jgi:DNA-directed RNA polymerase subunit RPC12/RpoP
MGGKQTLAAAIFLAAACLEPMPSLVVSGPVWQPRVLWAAAFHGRRGCLVRIELNCAQCGKNRFNLEQGVADHAVVSCQDCGHRIGTIAELKERVAAEVLKRSAVHEFD